MKRILAFFTAGMLLLGLAGCGENGAESRTIVLKVGASPAPHAEILEAARAELEAEDIFLEIVEFADYVQPNLALDAGVIDANFFQHTPYLEEFNEEHGTELISLGAVHYEPMGIYGGTLTDLSDIPEGTKVGIPNDHTNGGRALLLLEEIGLIKRDPSAGLTATVLDIAENPKELEFVEMEAAQLTLALEDLGFAVINGNYAVQNGLEMADALAIEEADSLSAAVYANIVAVKAGNEKKEGLTVLMDVLQGETVAEYIRNTYYGAAAPMAAK